MAPKSCGRENADIGNFCIACGAAKKDVISAQISEDVQWYYYKGSDRCGPVAASEIADLLRIKEIDRKTLVWKTGMVDLIPLNKTALNTLATDVVPPIPLQAASNKFAWALAIIPILVYTAFMLLGIPENYCITTSWILNLIFWVLDVNHIEKTGNELGLWQWLGLIYISAYLFARSYKVDHKYSYSISCIIFLFLCTFCL